MEAIIGTKVKIVGPEYLGGKRFIGKTGEVVGVWGDGMLTVYIENTKEYEDTAVFPGSSLSREFENALDMCRTYEVLENLYNAWKSQIRKGETKLRFGDWLILGFDLETASKPAINGE